MINLLKIKHRLIQFFSISKKGSYLTERYANIEKQYAEDRHIPFKITSIREKGFIVKASGLYGYVSFNHMPWKYPNSLSWKTIFPYLKGKILFGEIYQLNKDTHTIIIDGKIPQLNEPELIEDNKYRGIIINKTIYGVFVEIGYDFNWKCGSIVGLLHRSNFETNESFEKASIGDSIEMLFLGYNDQDKLIFGQKPELKEWLTGKIENLLGETIPVNIIKKVNQKRIYLAANKYPSKLQVKSILNLNNMPLVDAAVNDLKDGDIIHCKVIEVNKKKRTLLIRWELLSEIEYIVKSSKIQIKKVTEKDDQKKIKNRINDISSQFKKSYLIEDKEYKGKIINKSTKNVTIDIGYSFNWKFGSLTGLLHKLNFESIESFEKTNIGDIIEVFFWGFDKQNNPIFGQKAEHKVWATEEIDNLKNTVTPIKIIKDDNGNRTYLTDNEHVANLVLSKVLYPANKILIIKVLKNLTDGDIINCKITRINKKKRTLSIKWDSPSEIKHIIENRKSKIKGNSIINEQKLLSEIIEAKKTKFKNIRKPKTLKKLPSVGKKVKVKVIKRKSYLAKGFYTKYIINNRLEGKLEISHTNYKVNNTEKRILEKNLQNGDTAYCEVIKVEPDLITVKWLVSDNELFSATEN